eukprot:g6122.t1
MDEDACRVCGDPSWTEEDRIIGCESCPVWVHQSCYGVKHVPEGEWLCGPCSEVPPVKPEQLKCLFCKQGTGAFQKMAPAGQAADVDGPDGQWGHVCCALWLNGKLGGEGAFDDLEARVPISASVQTLVTQAAISKPCQVCKGMAAAVPCSVSSCAAYFHVNCGLMQGFVLLVWHEEREEVPDCPDWICLCRRHSSKYRSYEYGERATWFPIPKGPFLIHPKKMRRGLQEREKEQAAKAESQEQDKDKDEEDEKADYSKPRPSFTLRAPPSSSSHNTRTKSKYASVSTPGRRGATPTPHLPPEILDSHPPPSRRRSSTASTSSLSSESASSSSSTLSFALPISTPSPPVATNKPLPVAATTTTTTTTTTTSPLATHFPSPPTTAQPLAGNKLLLPAVVAVAPETRKQHGAAPEVQTAQTARPTGRATISPAHSFASIPPAPSPLPSPTASFSGPPSPAPPPAANLPAQPALPPAARFASPSPPLPPAAFTKKRRRPSASQQQQRTTPPPVDRKAGSGGGKRQKIPAPAATSQLVISGISGAQPALPLPPLLPKVPPPASLPTTHQRPVISPPAATGHASAAAAAVACVPTSVHGESYLPTWMMSVPYPDPLLLLPPSATSALDTPPAPRPAALEGNKLRPDEGKCGNDDCSVQFPVGLAASLRQAWGDTRVPLPKALRLDASREWASKLLQDKPAKNDRPDGADADLRCPERGKIPLSAPLSKLKGLCSQLARRGPDMQEVARSVAACPRLCAALLPLPEDPAYVAWQRSRRKKRSRKSTQPLVTQPVKPPGGEGKHEGKLDENKQANNRDPAEQMAIHEAALHHLFSRAVARRSQPPTQPRDHATSAQEILEPVVGTGAGKDSKVQPGQDVPTLRREVVSLEAKMIEGSHTRAANAVAGADSLDFAWNGARESPMVQIQAMSLQQRTQQQQWAEMLMRTLANAPPPAGQYNQQQHQQHQQQLQQLQQQLSQQLQKKHQEHQQRYHHLLLHHAATNNNGNKQQQAVTKAAATTSAITATIITNNNQHQRYQLQQQQTTTNASVSNTLSSSASPPLLPNLLNYSLTPGRPRKQALLDLLGLLKTQLDITQAQLELQQQTLAKFHALVNSMNF